MNPEQSTIDEVDINTSNSDGKGILDKECPSNGSDGSKGLQRIRKLYTPYEKRSEAEQNDHNSNSTEAKQSYVKCDEKCN